MARSIPPDRFDELVRCATDVFIRQGYRRTQMTDVATALGVAKGTLYLYVESKEALFDLVVRRADGSSAPPRGRVLPIPAPRHDATLRFVRERLARGQTLPALAAALTATKVADACSELEGITRELFDTLDRHRTAIKLIDSCARDYPALASVWFEGGRGALLESLAVYLEQRMGRGLLPKTAEPRLAARLILETVVTWAVHRHWDPAPQEFERSAVRDAVVHLVVYGFGGGQIIAATSPVARREKTS